MRISTLILPALNCVVWGGIAWVGHGLLKRVEGRVGHSDLVQADFYLVFPLLMLILFVTPAVLLSQTRWALVGNIWSVFALIPLVYFLMVSGGGV